MIFKSMGHIVLPILFFCLLWCALVDVNQITVVESLSKLMCESNRSHSTVFAFIETATAMATATTIKCFRPKNRTTRIWYCSIKHQFNINHQSENARLLVCLLTLLFCVFIFNFPWTLGHITDQHWHKSKLKRKTERSWWQAGQAEGQKKYKRPENFKYSAAVSQTIEYKTKWSPLERGQKKQTNKKQHREKEKTEKLKRKPSGILICVTELGDFS